MPNRDVQVSPSKEGESVRTIQRNIFLSDLYGKYPNVSQTLLFKRCSHDPTPNSEPRHERTVKREWAGVASPIRRETEQGAQGAKNGGQSTPDAPTLMQRWLGEGERDQPYNNIGSFFSKYDKEQKD